MDHLGEVRVVVSPVLQQVISMTLLLNLLLLRKMLVLLLLDGRLVLAIAYLFRDVTKRASLFNHFQL